jgi:hypothetical protein
MALLRKESTETLTDRYEHNLNSRNNKTPAWVPQAVLGGFSFVDDVTGLGTVVVLAGFSFVGDVTSGLGTVLGIVKTNGPSPPFFKSTQNSGVTGSTRRGRAAGA